MRDLCFRLILTFALTLAAKEENYRSYTWIEDDPTFDCVVAVQCKVKDNYTHVMTAAFIKENVAVGSGKGYHRFTYRFFCYFSTIGTNYQSSIASRITHSYDDYKRRDRTYWWPGEYIGQPSGPHNLWHDLVLLRAPTMTVASEPSVGGDRAPYHLKMARTHSTPRTSGWRTAAFALLSKEHVHKSNKLESVFYEDHVLVDCDEWFPRRWGYFICIENTHNYPGIDNGAPLIQDGLVYGVASFMIQMGNQSVFVFTDLRRYRKILVTKMTEYLG